MSPLICQDPQLRPYDTTLEEPAGQNAVYPRGRTPRLVFLAMLCVEVWTAVANCPQV